MRYKGVPRASTGSGETGLVTVNANVKKVLTWLVVAFVLWFLFTQPTQSADLVQGVVGLLQQAAEAVITFFRSLV